ncbi:TetR/AcrR family transcriptional regulator [Streptomyces ficellus]|uniref:TetR/AcrR family transcriptional regulator n=1 Tax=Streptomyces ficellus TaxID=1977088 RepID=A0A6I6F9N6_9ACTN|nr:TetR/AcrR family transcriptional regulator [Streptomyces ficellus]QGV79801.1 TetR/AcrR family transcriptional regulator [Streptomyces ficellus]
MHIQDSRWSTALASSATASSASAATASPGEGLGGMHGRPGVGGHGAGGHGAGGHGAGGSSSRTAPLRVDAQRNLEHVLRAAREVFGELGYGAPMEDVARRARVGVGTVYRRFPSKDVLVRRIAEEETARLTEQARTALGQEEEPWSALSRFLRTSVASGAGRLLPPHVLRVGVDEPGAAPDGSVPGGSVPSGSGEELRVPQQRGASAVAAVPVVPVAPGQPELRVVPPRAVPVAELDDAGASELLEVVGQLVDRAREAGELRGDVTVADVLLVIATAAPSLPDAAQQSAASARLLDILLEGLRSRPA